MHFVQSTIVWTHACSVSVHHLKFYMSAVDSFVCHIHSQQGMHQLVCTRCVVHCLCVHTYVCTLRCVCACMLMAVTEKLRLLMLLPPLFSILCPLPPSLSLSVSSPSLLKLLAFSASLSHVVDWRCPVQHHHLPGVVAMGAYSCQWRPRGRGEGLDGWGGGENQTQWWAGGVTCTLAPPHTQTVPNCSVWLHMHTCTVCIFAASTKHTERRHIHTHVYSSYSTYYKATCVGLRQPPRCGRLPSSPPPPLPPKYTHSTYDHSTV